MQMEKTFDLKNRRYPAYICIIEVMVLLLMTIFLCNRYKNRTVAETALSDWTSGYVSFAGDGWYINEKYFEDNVNIIPPIEFLTGPSIELPKGSYTIKIQYIAENDQVFRAGNSDFIRSGDATLSKNKTSLDYHIIATEDIEDFNISFNYNGQGLLGIQSVFINKNTVGIRTLLTCMFFLMIAFNGLLFLSTRSKEEKRTFWLLIGIILLASLPAMKNTIHCDANDDLMFHLVRIEGISQEILNGSIPVKMSSFWMDGYGYPVSIYYGDILLYIPAILRLIGFSITTCYIIYIFIINTGTTFLSYLCFGTILDKSNHKSNHKSIAFLTCLAYVTATYRLVNIYSRGAVGEYSAMMFFPIIALAIYRIYTTDCSNWTLYRKNALVLAIGMSGLIETHILSVEMTVVTLGLISLIFWKKTFRINTIKVYILSVVETLFFNMWFIVPFLDYFTNVSVKTNYIDPLINYSLTGASLAELFSFFPNTNGSVIIMPTPGIAFIATLILAICYIYCNRKQSDRQILFYTLLSIIMLFIASSLFPWKHLVKNYNFMKILSQVQFPWRYIGIANVFLTLLLGRLMVALTEKNKNVHVLICSFSGICIISMLYINSSVVNAGSVRFYDAPELNTSCVVGGEYMLACDGRQAEEKRGLTGRIATDHIQEAFISSRKGTEMHIYCKTIDTEGKITVPLFNYKGYHVYDEHGKEYNTYTAENFVIGFTVPANFDGNFTIKFVEPWYWRMAEAISLMAISILIIKSIICYIQKRRYLVSAD